MVQSLRQWQVADLIGIGGAYYTSQKIFGDPDQGGTLLLAPGQGPINVLGKAYVRARVLDNDFRGDRQLVDTPLISPRDNRMVPIPYEAATINSVPDKDRMYDYAAGYLWNTKLRDSNDFKPMSDALAGRGRRRPRGAIWDGQSPTDHRNGSHRHGLQHRALHQYGFCPSRDRRLAMSQASSIRHEPPTPTCSNTRSIAPAKKLLVLALPMTSAIPSAT